MKVILSVSLLIAILIVVPVSSFAEIWPIPEGEYIDPVRAYYDEKNRIAQQVADENRREKIQSEFVSFNLSIPNETTCGWIEVTGRVPSYGIVNVHLWKELEVPEVDGYTHLYERMWNLNSQETREDRGSIYIPCSEGSGNYAVTLTWISNPSSNDIVDTYIDKHAMSVSQRLMVSNFWN